MSANTVLLAVILGLSPSIVVASVLVLVAGHGRPKAIALAAGWVSALAVVALVSFVAAHDLHLTRHSRNSKVLDVADVVLGVVLLVSGIVLFVRSRRAATKDPKWMARLDAMPVWGAFALGAFLPPYALVVAGVSEIVRQDAAVDARSIAGVVFLVIGSIGAFAPLAVSFLSRDPERTLARWHAWIARNWRSVLVVILLVGGVYLVTKGAVEWAQDAGPTPATATTTTSTG